MGNDASAPRSIVITGASSGIGEALAEAYAASEVTLWLSGRNPTRLESVASRCRDRGALVHAEVVDVADRAATAAWIARIDETSGLDLVIANAGISGGTGGIGGEDEEQVRDIFAVNMAGVLNTVLPAIPRMQLRGQGQLALMASMAAFRGLPTAPAYAASKAAVLSYGDGLRGELRESGIRVSVICPGFVKSRITDANDYYMPFFMPADRAARIIRRGLARNRPRIVFPWRMRAIMWLLAALPAGLTDAVLRRAPRKT